MQCFRRHPLGYLLRSCLPSAATDSGGSFNLASCERQQSTVGGRIYTVSEVTLYNQYSCICEICYAQRMQANARSRAPLYVRIAETFTHQVANGALRPGDRVPSLRKLSEAQGVSLSTALQA